MRYVYLTKNFHEIWKYHEKTIEKLTDDDVINAVHVLKRRYYCATYTQ